MIDYVSEDDKDYASYIGFVGKRHDAVAAVGMEPVEGKLIVIYDYKLDERLYLTPEQASDLAALLTKAAEIASRT